MEAHNGEVTADARTRARVCVCATRCNAFVLRRAFVLADGTRWRAKMRRRKKGEEKTRRDPPSFHHHPSSAFSAASAETLS